MPIYVHECQACGRTSEDYQSIRESPPACCGAPMQRIPQAAGSAFITKGGNWAHFTPSHGAVTKGNKRPRTIGLGRGLGKRMPKVGKVTAP